jgi:hypothetical protein
MICEFENIELISEKDVYILENLKPNQIQKSEWEIFNAYSRERRKIEPEKRMNLNCLIEGNLKYRIPSDDKSVLCLYMHQEFLLEFIKNIESLLK